MNGNQNTGTPVEAASMGKVILMIVVMGVLVLLGLYFLTHKNGTGMNDANSYNTNETAAVIDTTKIDAQSSSDSTTSIEKDLQSTDITTVDSSVRSS